MRKQEDKGDSENDFSNDGKDGRHDGLAHRLQIDEGRLVDGCQRHHAKIDSEAANRKISVVTRFIGRTEQCDNLVREDLEDHERDQTHDKFTDQKSREEVRHTIVASRAKVESGNRNTARGHPDGNRDDDLEALHDDADAGHRDLRILRL